MNQKLMGTRRLRMLVLSAFLSAAWPARAQENKAPYPKEAPIEQYLMADRNAEIALARTAAPEDISRDAKILVLTRRGYETAAEGKNGFVCLVERAWMAPFDNAEFWNPKNRSPLCLNPQAARFVLPIDYKRAEMVLAGKSKEHMKEWTEAAYARKELPAVEPGGMSYMMSKAAYLTDNGDHNLAHVMFYTPLMDKANWGADVPNSPIMLLQKGPPEPYNVFIIPVGKWSDGTAAPAW